jgi:hypothetical protein
VAETYVYFSSWQGSDHLGCDGEHLLCPPLLMVNFCQPSHEFTFGVGIDSISKLTILTLMICQVHICMWFLEFVVYARF